jgi:hypothetical protein
MDDFENFEFRSPVNPWTIQRQYKADFDKIKTLEIELIPGKIIYIPAYWWYSIKFVEPLSSVCVFKYRTYMNTVAILPRLCMKTLQRQNTKREVVKKARIQKNEMTTKGKVTLQQQQQLQTNQNNVENVLDSHSTLAPVTPTPAPAPANSESLESNIVDNNDEDITDKSRNAITLSLLENGYS